MHCLAFLLQTLGFEKDFEEAFNACYDKWRSRRLDKVGTSWMNWTVTAVIPFAILILAPMTTTHARYDLDTMHTNAGSSTADPDAWDGDSLPRDESEGDKNKPLLSYTA